MKKENNVVNIKNKEADLEICKILILNIGSHYFGAIIDNVQDVIKRSPTTPIPLAPDHVIGLLNLRGHIVTEIDVAKTLDIKEDAANSIEEGFSVVINHSGEMYSLVFDGVGGVIDVPKSSIEKLPDTIDTKWCALSKGVYRLDKHLVVVLDFKLFIEYLTPTQKTLYN